MLLGREPIKLLEKNKELKIFQIEITKEEVLCQARKCGEK
jgi:hypothetical protein